MGKSHVVGVLRKESAFYRILLNRIREVYSPSIEKGDFDSFLGYVEAFSLVFYARGARYTLGVREKFPGEEKAGGICIEIKNERIRFATTIG